MTVPLHVLEARRYMLAVGSALREKRDWDDLSTRELADQIGVRHDVITRIERGQWIPDDDDAQRVANYLTGWSSVHV